MNNEQSTNNKLDLLRKNGVIYSAICAGVLLLVAAIIMIVLAANGAFSTNVPITNVGDNSTNETNSGSTSTGNGTGNGNSGTTQPTDKVDETYFSPVETMTLMTEHGFYYNSTLNCYYEHAGIDVTAPEGAGVYSIADGRVEEIYTSDLLQGAEVVVSYADDTKCIYRYVNPVESLKVGETVARGQMIATVAAATGSEYKDGSHLHLELTVNNKAVDPADYLTLQEK